MPTISQLPTASSVAASDQIPLSQDGVARSTSVASLLADVQPAIMVGQGSLLGRTSIGAGGPEEIVVGPGLVLNDGTLTTADGLLNALEALETIAGEDRLVIRRDGQLGVVPVSAIRVMHKAGGHITIDGDGTIAAVWPTAADIGASGSVDIRNLPRSHALLASDLIPINRGGVNQATTYATLLNAQTIDQAAPAGACGDSDLVWVAQAGNTMARQSFSAIWSWIAGRLPDARRALVEIGADTVLDGTVHNGRTLVCTQPVLISPSIQNMGAGFHCEVINLSAGPVTFADGIILSSDDASLAPRRSAFIRLLALASGAVAYANVQGASIVSSLPGAVQNLTVAAVTASSIGLTWVAPTTGAPPFTYTILYRVSGAGGWTNGPSGLTDALGSLQGLTSGVTYEVVVVAANASGSGNLSGVVTAATQGSASTPGQPLNLTATTQGPNSVSLAWAAPTSGGAVASYVVQHRSVGASVWSNSLTGLTVRTAVISGLTAATAYEFRVLAENTDGIGPASAVASATTEPMAGAVTSIQWNLTPAGPYTHGSGAIGVNVLVTPSNAAVRLGFSTSATVPPATWTLAVHVMTNLWGAYVDTPATAGTWYAWAQGTDGSATTPYATPFTVQ